MSRATAAVVALTFGTAGLASCASSKNAPSTAPTTVAGNSTNTTSAIPNPPLNLTVAVPYTTPPIFSVIPFEAKRLGYFSRAGLNVKFVSVESSGGPVQLLVGKQVDVAAVFTPDSVDAFLAPGGSAIRYISGYCCHAALLDTYGASTSINAPCDLKGKTLGVGTVPTPSDPEYMSFEQLLQSCHLTDKDVHFAVTGTINQTIQGLLAHRIDIAQIDIDDTPLLSTDPKLHLVHLVVPGTYRGWGYAEGNVTRADVISDPVKAQAIQIYTTTIIKLARLMQQNESLAMDTAMHYDTLLQGKSADFLHSFYQEWVAEWLVNGMMNVPSIKEFLDKAYYLANPQATGKVDVATFVDPRFVKATLDQIGVLPYVFFWDKPDYNPTDPPPAGDRSL